MEGNQLSAKDPREAESPPMSGIIQETRLGPEEDPFVETISTEDVAKSAFWP